MRVLWQVTSTTFLRHFTDVVLTLADRGHQVRVAQSENDPDLPPPAALKDHPRISFVDAPCARGDAWASATVELRALRDYLNYLDPAFDHSPKLRRRGFQKMLKMVSGKTHRHLTIRCPHCNGRMSDQQIVDAVRAGYSGLMAGLASRLELIESAIRPDAGITDFLRRERPDVVLVTPLIWIGSRQADYVKSAQELQIPVGYPVFSWDNLSTKGIVHVLPDRVYVWNDRQKAEAIARHRVPPERIDVIGAARFDRFFAMTPESTRAAFCAAHGLDASQPIVAYLCSSEFVADTERDWVMRWIDEIRQHPTLAPCNIVIRPHPRCKREWKEFDPGRPRVAVTFPASISTDRSLFDTLHHSVAVVGLNTSAQLEAGIVGRPVLTVIAPEFAGGQEGTLHFQYLLKPHGGFVEVAPDFDSHRTQLAAAVAGEYDAEAIRSFIESFLRPLGHERPVSPAMADASERLAQSGRRGPGWWRSMTG
jgi:hypothetical protein